MKVVNDHPTKVAAPVHNGKAGGKSARSTFLERGIFARTRAPAFRRYLEKLLLELCRIDTTPHAEVPRMRAAEEGCFRILQRELDGLCFPGAKTERRPINAAIQNHPHYSFLHFTKTAQRPEGLSPEKTYEGRTNLLFFAPGRDQVGRASSARLIPGSSVALNAHIDVVRPYFPPRSHRGIIYGRGACDDKGSVVAIIGALKALSEVMAETRVTWHRNVLAMFVIEEETGGNGSLSLAIERDLKRGYDCILVGECTGLKIHPANRGAVWYRAELNALLGVSPFEMFAFINEELEKEGAAIRAESWHPLFPQRPVQTCHGVIGPYGEHPSRVCGELVFELVCQNPRGRALEKLVLHRLESGLEGYLGLYGDKTKVREPSTGKPMVVRHYDLKRRRNGFEVAVHGATGHMGMVRERDGAITKAAHLIRSLLFSKSHLETAAGSPVVLKLKGVPCESCLILEGGQGFVPTHALDQIMSRVRRAAERGAESYLRRQGRKESGHEAVTVTFEKLHNVAFDGDLASAAMRNALAAAEVCGLPQQRPVLGWTVSCDARLFASEYPGMPVLTFGPGDLVYAHSDQEQIAVEDIRAAVEFLAVFLLRQTGTGKQYPPKRGGDRQDTHG